MPNVTILGTGPLGRSIEVAHLERGLDPPRVLGRPPAGRHAPDVFTDTDVVIDASTGSAVIDNVGAALGGGCRRFVIAATGWDADRTVVADEVRLADAVAVVAPNLSLGAAIFLRLTEHAARLFDAAPTFDPYVIEWHRRDKRDRPSGTAREIVRRLGREVEVASVRSGASPGMHRVGFDSAGETIELQLTARDRSAYAAGALAAVEWLVRGPRPAGVHAFDTVVDDVLGDSLPAIA